MKILAIETSCDETGIAVVEGQIRRLADADGFEFEVLKNVLLSQAQLHAQFGGVYPNLAKREHQKNLPVLFEKFANEKVDAIAVTHGPGLEPALWTGIEFAKKLANQRHVPLLPTNHMEGHLISSLVRHTNKLENVGMFGELRDVKFPVLALLISGGHTEFVLMKEWFTYEIIGETLDDAVGEAFDKVARMLGLPYPGGPEISKLAKQAREVSPNPVSQKSSGRPTPQSVRAGFQTFAQQDSATLVTLPRPMLYTNSCNVSFSGLKTAALYALRDMGGIQKLSARQIADFAREFEDAVTEVFVAKTRRALEQTGAQTFVIGGGVAANKHIRKNLQKLVEDDFSDVDFRLPELSITGDNAVMIAEAALARRLSGLDDSTQDDIRAVGNLSISAQK